MRCRQPQHQRMVRSHALTSTLHVLLMCAALDEATSSLDEAAEESLFVECARSGITLLTVGHRSSLRKVGTVMLLAAKCL